MLADIDDALGRAMNHDGSKRFYPPHCHPSTHKLRQHLFFLERLAEKTNAGRDREEIDRAITHDREQITAFEMVEDVQKAKYFLEYTRTNPQDRGA